MSSELTELEGREISVSFWNDRRVNHPPRRRKGQHSKYAFVVECVENRGVPV